MLQHLDLFEEQRRLIQDEMSLEIQAPSGDSEAGSVGHHATQQLVSAHPMSVSEFELDTTRPEDVEIRVHMIETVGKRRVDGEGTSAGRGVQLNEAVEYLIPSFGWILQIRSMGKSIFKKGNGQRKSRIK